MNQHTHADIEDVLFITLAAFVGLNALRILATWLAAQSSPAVASVGEGIGGGLRFGNS